MGKDTKIEWCDDSGNLWWGCDEVHEGCDRCYAKVGAKRYGFDIWGHDKSRRIIMSVWDNLAKFQQIAKENGGYRRVFIGSQMDIFEKPMPLVRYQVEKHPDKNGEMKNMQVAYPIFLEDGTTPMTTEHLRQRFFKEVVPNCPNLLFLLTTKRPGNINKYIPEAWKDSPPPNILYLTSISTQKHAETIVPKFLSQVNGLKGLSIEPQLGLIDLTRIKIDPLKWSGDTYLNALSGYMGNEYRGSQRATRSVSPLNWVINGGESGHGRRPFDVDWARCLRDQCQEPEPIDSLYFSALPVPFFFKQIDKVNKEIPEDLMVREFPAYN